MIRKVSLAVCAALFASSACATEIPAFSFFTGNDIYGWCQHDKEMAQGYTAGLFDSAAHAAAVIADTRNFGNMPKNDAQVDFALTRVVGYCSPHGATLEQVTDVFCAYLREKPAERHSLPPILFSEALTKAWPCPER